MKKSDFVKDEIIRIVQKLRHFEIQISKQDTSRAKKISVAIDILEAYAFEEA